MKLDEISSILNGDISPSQMTAPDADKGGQYRRVSAAQAKRNELKDLTKMKTPIRALDLRKSLNTNKKAEAEKIMKIIDNLQYVLGLSAGTSIQSIVEAKINDLLRVIHNKQQ